MSVYLIQESSLTNIADSIRAKTGETDKMTVGEMPEKIDSISSGSYNIEVTVDSGAVVTVTNGINTYTDTSTGTCNFTVQEEGNWTCSATLDGKQSNSSVVNVNNNFSTFLSFSSAQVLIETLEEIVVTAIKGNSILRQTASSTGIASFTIIEPGDWTFIIEKDGKTITETVTITEEKTYEIYLSFNLLDLNLNSWKHINKISQEGKARNYWSIGDRKAIHLKGTMGTLALDTTLWLYILGFDHNAKTEGYGITFSGFKSNNSSGINVCLVDRNYGKTDNKGTKYFSMNHWSSSGFGGWAASDIRYDVLGSTDVAPSEYGSSKPTSAVGYDATETCAINPVANTLMSCLPADLRAVMKPITKWTSVRASNSRADVTAKIDYLPLLSEFEVRGQCLYTNKYEQDYQAQYEYYSAGNSQIKYKHSETTSASQWWLRSICYDNSSTFCSLNVNTTPVKSSSYYSYGIVPILLV